MNDTYHMEGLFCGRKLTFLPGCWMSENFGLIFVDNTITNQHKIRKVSPAKSSI